MIFSIILQYKSTNVLSVENDINQASNVLNQEAPVSVIISVRLRPVLRKIAVRFARQSLTIRNGNRTELSPIRSDVRAAGVRFVNHEYDYRPNWATRSLITN